MAANEHIIIPLLAQIPDVMASSRQVCAYPCVWQQARAEALLTFKPVPVPLTINSMTKIVPARSTLWNSRTC